MFFTSSSFTGLAQNPSLVTKSGQAYLGKFRAKVDGSTLVKPIRNAPDQSDSSGLPITEMQYNSPSSNGSWLKKINSNQYLKKTRTKPGCKNFMKFCEKQI